MTASSACESSATAAVRRRYDTRSISEGCSKGIRHAKEGPIAGTSSRDITSNPDDCCCQGDGIQY